MTIWSNKKGGIAHPNFKIGHLFATDNPSFAAHDATLAAHSFHPARIKEFYGIPGDGAGKTICLIELGGSYYDADIKAAGSDPAQVKAVYIDGAEQVAGDADGEVALDIQVALGIAPKASIRVYFAPNTGDGFFNAVAQAYKDLGGQYAPTFVASGDNGYLDGSSTKTCDFPASAPYAIACGGTHILRGVETVWNNLAVDGGASGGGVSALFSVPEWQYGQNYTELDGKPKSLSGRGVPDVCGNADPDSGYIVWINGQQTVVGGTSAVAPLWAGLMACLGYNTVSISWGGPEDQWSEASRDNLANLIQQNALSGPNVLPVFYAHPKAFHDILPPGDNGDYEVTKGWDAATGLGSLIGKQVAAILAASAETQSIPIPTDGSPV